MPEQPPSHWFPAKRHGWGWGMPRTWQGWAVLLLYIAVVGATSLTVRNLAMSSAIVLAASVLVLVLCVKKGEPTRWRWGQ